MNILRLCGSIREGSSNHMLLQAVQKLAPSSWTWSDFEIKQLPFFDPQMQFSEDLPAIVKTLRKQAEQAEYIFIATPEYAHGIPGILKNALEWLVCEETMNKKVVVFVVTPSGGEFVQEYLLETLKTMDMKVSREMTFVVRSARRDISSNGEITQPELKASLQTFLARVSN